MSGKLPWNSPADVPCVTGPGDLKSFERVPLHDLLCTASCVFCLFTGFRSLAIRFVLDPFSTRMVGRGSYNHATHQKFIQAAWRAVVHATATGYALSFLFLGGSELTFLSNTTLFWKDWPHQEVSSYEREGMFSLYALYIGMYAHHLVLIAVDLVGDDYLALVAHHVTTLSIVLGSWCAGFTRVGACTMVLHDCSDVLLEFAKCFNYVKKYNPKYGIGADFCFGGFAVSFFYLRLYVLPRTTVYSSVAEACGLTTCFEADRGLDTWTNCATVSAWRFFTAGLLLLQALQVLWAVKIVQVLINVATGKELSDVREVDHEDAKDVGEARPMDENVPNGHRRGKQE